MKLTFFDKIKRFLKLIYSCPNYNKIIKKINIQNGKRAILIGTPVHGNLGDHLIASESLKYLKKFKFSDIIEVPEILYELFYKKINIFNDDIIFVSGGGWMGSLYYDELIIEDIIKRYKNNNIIILPQTVSFASGSYTTQEKLSKIIKNHKSILLTVRDEKSYNFCIKILKINKDNVLLLPDMALIGLNKISNNITKSNSIIFSMRNDIEKNINVNYKEIKSKLEKKNIKVFESSSVISKKVIKIADRDKYLDLKIKEFSNSKIIITDRLHSMIFSLLAGTKCIAIDNSTHKVIGVYKKWLNNCPAIWIIDKKDQLNIDLIDKVLNSNINVEPKNFEEIFKQLDIRIGELL